MSTGPAMAPPVRAAAPPGRAPAAAGGPDRAPEAVRAGGPSFSVSLGATAIDVALTGVGVKRDGNGWTIDVSALGLPLPGVTLRELRVNRAADGTPSGGELRGIVSAPFVRGEAKLAVDAQGSVSGGVEATFHVEVLGRQKVSFSYVDRTWSGRLAVDGSAISLPIPGVTIDKGSVVVTFSGADIAGTLSASFRHAALGDASIEARIGRDGFEGQGSFAPTLPFLRGLNGTFALTREGALSGSLALIAAGVQLPIPGLRLSTLSGSMAYAAGEVSGSMAFTAEYAGLGRLALAQAAFDARGLARASGTFELTAPPVAGGASGKFTLDRQGRPHGSLKLQGPQIPIPALKRGSLTVTLREDGGVDVAGAGRIELGPVGGGDFEVAWEEGRLRLGTRATISVPPLQPVTLAADYVDGQLKGEANVPLALGPLNGAVTVRYAGGQFSGDGTLAYALGRFDGSVSVQIDHAGHVSGSGDAKFQISPWLAGRIGLTVHPDLNVDAIGELSLPSEVELFDPWVFERSFFNFDQEFPLWGLTIPVVGSIGLIASVHASAGFRARFGPGTLRNARAVGELSTRPDAEPAFTISGDLTIPAGAEVVLTVGGGIGLAALIAKIEGGIDLSGIAGVYGAITLTPTFAYRDGKYTLSGSALLAAVAQLSAQVNAYARVVAGIGWFSGEVWRKDWNLAEWIFDSGWNVGVRAGIEYVVGEPFVPDVTLEPVDVDPKAIIKQAIPSSGEPVAAPPKPPAPKAEFTPAAGSPGAVGAVPAAPGSAPTAPDAAPAPAPGAAPAPSAPAAGGPAGAGAPAGPQAEPGVAPPETVAEPADERSIDETYLLYVYDSLQQHFARRKAPTAPTDRELARSAAERERHPRGGLPGPSERSGSPLSPQLRARMESAFGADLTDVRIHDDEQAREGARALGAEAYTVGSDIYLGPSRQAGAGDASLLAHELTHVLQARAAGGKTVGEPGGPAEQEAAAAAAAVARGERPEPIKQRREAEAHLLPAPTPSPSAPAATGATPPAAVTQGSLGATPFDETKLKHTLASAANDPAVAAAIKQLKSKSDVAAEAASEVWDHATAKFTKRGLIPMRFPGPEFLPRKGLYGDTQIAPGLVLEKRGGERTDDMERNQSKLSRLMYASAPKLFPKHQRGTKPAVTFENVYDAYRAYQDAQKPPLPQFHDTPQDAREYDSTASVQNLSLTEKGARKLCLRTVGGVEVPHFDFAGGKWQRVLEEPEPSSSAAPAGAAQASPAAAAATPAQDDAVPMMVASYEAHHVIPLWLESEPGGPVSGDNLVNLVPWFHGAHQTNHGFHHKATAAVTEATGKKDYRDFGAGARFVISTLDGGNRPHPDPPPYELAPDQTWQPKSPPLWWG